MMSEQVEKCPIDAGQIRCQAYLEKFPKELHESRDMGECEKMVQQALEGLVPEGDGHEYPFDLFLQGLLLGRENRWSWQCTAKLLDILQSVLDFERANPTCTMDQSFERFKQTILLYSCERPPWMIGMYSREQVVLITNFVAQNHYRHFAMHRHLNSASVETLELLNNK